MIINSVGRIFSQCTHISNLHMVHLKYLTILFVNYISMKLEKRIVLLIKI